MESLIEALFSGIAENMDFTMIGKTMKHPRLPEWLDRLGGIFVLALPLALIHSRALGDVLVTASGLLFLAQSAIRRDWGWLKSTTVRLSLVWWAWVVVCSLLDPKEANIAQAFALIRWPVLVAGLEFWLLRDAGRRRWVVRFIQFATIYIALQEAIQFVFGRNLFGDPRRPSGELTGPYDEPRAGPIVSRLIFPAAFPPVCRLMARGIGGIVAGGVLLCLCVASVVLFGQRMPTVLTAFGLLVGGLILPRLRWMSLVALVAGGGLIVASAWISPPTFNRLVLKFSAQLASWPTSDYGELAARATAIAQAHPLIGRGFDAFHKACTDRIYWHGWPQILHGVTGFTPTYPPPMTDMPAVWAWLHSLGGANAICAQHPHNHYLQALEESGVPGLILFSAMIVGWGRALLMRYAVRTNPLRAGLFVAFLVQEWPIASTSDFVNMPLGGWFFLLLGLGLAEARAERDISPETESTHAV